MPGGWRWSFAAMEQYFQREGRDWERYAWQKARPVAGDIDAGERFLRDAAAVRLPALPRLRRARRPARDEGGDRRRSRAQGTGRRHQARPRRHPRDRIPGAGAAADPRRPRAGAARAPPAAGAGRRWSTPATSRAETGARAGARPTASCAGWRTACRCCATRRRTRCRRTRWIARASRTGSAIDDWDGVARRARRAARARRRRIRRAAGAAPAHAPRRDALAGYWRALARRRRRRRAGRRRLRRRRAAPTRSLRDFARAPGVRALSDARARAPGPRAAGAARQPPRASPQPDAALRRLLPLLHNILRRASYLALLDEQPAALAAAGRRARAQRAAGRAPGRASAAARRTARRARRRPAARTRRDASPPATRRCAHGRHRSRAARAQRNAAGAELPHRAGRRCDGRQPAQRQRAAAGLAGRCVVAVVLQLAQREMQRAHGAIAGARFAVLGYGSLGGEELGFGSDLDLVFLYDAAGRRAFRRRAPARRAALVRAAGAEDRGAARHGHRRRPPVRRRRAPAPGRRQGPAGVDAWRASPTTSASAPGPGSTRRWCARAASPATRRCAPSSNRCAAQTLARARDAATLRDDVRRDARADARRAGPLATPRASTSSRARAGWSTWNSCCSTLVLRDAACASGVAGAARHAGPAATRLRRPAPSTPRPAPTLRAAHATAARRRPALHARPAPAASCRRDRCDRRGARRDPRRPAGAGLDFAG